MTDSAPVPVAAAAVSSNSLAAIDPIWVIMGGGAVCLLIIIMMMTGGNDAALQRRLKQVSDHQAITSRRTGVKVASGLTRRNYTGAKLTPWGKFTRAVMPNPARLRARLDRTGKDIGFGTYGIMIVISGMVSAMIAALSVGFNPTTMSLAGLAGGLFLPHKIINRMGEKRCLKFLKDFPEAIDSICRGLRSGLPVSESIASVGREMRDPVGVEFRHIADRIHLGSSMEDAMWEVEKRLDIAEFRFLIIAMAIQRETGGNLAETLGNLSDLLRRRQQMKMKIRAMSSEARASAMILGSLPFLMFCLLMLVNPSYVMTLIDDPRGNIVGGGALCWLMTGFFVMGRMVKFEI